jgi:O-antigen/teichoic acid export membrane protein
MKYRIFVSSFFTYLISELLVKIIPFLSLLIIARLISIEDFGLIALYMVYYELFFILVSNNSAAAFRVVYFQKSEESLTEHIQIHNEFSIFLFLICSVISIFLTKDFYVFFILLCATLRAINIEALTLFQCDKNPRKYTLSNSINYIITCITGISLALIGLGYKSYLVGIFLGNVFQLVISLKRIKKYFSIKSKWKINKDKIRIFLFGLTFLPQAIGWWIKSSSDRKIIEIKLGDIELGRFAFISQLASILLICANAINLVFVPILFERLKNKKYQSIYKIIFIFFLILVMILVLGIFISIILINIGFKEKYGSTIYFIPFIFISIIPQPIFYFFANIHYFYKKSQFIALLILISSACQAVINYLLIQKYQMLGMFITNFSINSIILILSLIFNPLNKKIKENVL